MSLERFTESMRGLKGYFCDIGGRLMGLMILSGVACVQDIREVIYVEG